MRLFETIYTIFPFSASRSRMLSGLLFLLWGIRPAVGQVTPEALQFKVYSFEENLSHRNVFKIAQDPWGSIWVATINGLNRFDGREFIHYRNSLDESFPLNDQFISDLVIAKDSLIWLAVSNYIVRLDPRSNESRKITVAKGSRVYNQNRSFNSLFADSKGQLWTAAYLNESGRSFLQVSNGAQEMEDLSGAEGNFARRSIIEFEGHYYFAHGRNRLRALDAEGKTIRDYQLPYYYGRDAAGWVSQLWVGKDGRLWALLDNGLVYFLDEGATDFELHPISSK
ncbi:MAG: two-component regulator propeller domain-containing protein, partial [Bacteroidota bacterium]